MADEKRQDGTSDICHRIHVSLWDMSSQAQALPYAPRPGLHSGHDVPAAQHKMELPAGGAARNPRPAGDNGNHADTMGLQDDTKSASRCTLTTYARHQMERPCSQDSTTQEPVWCPQWPFLTGTTRIGQWHQPQPLMSGVPQPPSPYAPKPPQPGTPQPGFPNYHQTYQLPGPGQPGKQQ
jgi:hypothetical protein